MFSKRKPFLAILCACAATVALAVTPEAEARRGWGRAYYGPPAVRVRAPRYARSYYAPRRAYRGYGVRGSGVRVRAPGVGVYIGW